MRRKSLSKLIIFSVISILSIGIVVGCGNSNTDESGLKGMIKIDGSSTTSPLTEAIAEEFNSTNYNVQIPIGVSGTGGGFKRFTNGETDIQNASRKIKDDEVEKARNNGIKYTEYVVAYDGITLCVSKENTFVDSLTVEELKKMWEPNSSIKTWKDLREEWPDKTIKFYSPGPDSGTFDFFTEAIVEKSKAIRNDINPSEDDNVLVQGVAGDSNAIGFFGYSFYEENEEKLRAIKVDNGDGAIGPTFDTIKTGTYAPLSRELYIYVNDASMEKEQVKAFVKYYLGNAKDIVIDVGFIPLNDEKYESELSKIK